MCWLATCLRRLPLVLGAWLGATAPLPAAEPRLRVELTPPGDLYPALDLSQAVRGDAPHGGGTGLLRIHVENPGAARTVRLRVQTPGLRAPAVLETGLAAGQSLEWWPRLAWDAAAVQALAAPRRQVLAVRLESAGAAAAQEVDVRLHGLDEALYYVSSDGQAVDLAGIFAAYVDPHSPAVDAILGRAGLLAEAAQAVPGTRGRSRRLALAEVVWTELVRRGLRYSAEVLAIEAGPHLYSQRVQLPGQTWQRGSAHCLDASVLIASVLERLGIPTFLVLVPGHAFVGFYVDPERRQAEFVETTLLAAGGTSAASFAAARAAGRTRYRDALPHLTAGARPGYVLIDTTAARAYGIMPLAVGAGSGEGRVPSRE